MKTLKDTLTHALRSVAGAALCHRGLYGQLSGCHGFAAYATGKPEIYLPMAALYAVLALRGP